MRDDPARRVPCPFCSAPIGARCRGPAVRPEGVHRIRVLAYVAITGRPLPA